MNWQFLAFTVWLCLVIYLHFAFAHRELRALKLEQPLEINGRYVQIEDYFGQSFRQKLIEWLKLPRTVDQKTGEIVVAKGAESIRVTGSVQYEPYTSIDDILVINGDLSCSAGCTFSREVYVKGNCAIGAGSKVQAIAVEGSLDLGPSASVTRWADSAGLIALARGSRVQARVTSRTAVHLGLQAEVASAFAPQVMTAGRQDRELPTRARPPETLVIPLDGASPPESGRKGAFDAKKLYPITPDCWLYNGSLELASPLHLKAKLIVKGHFSCPGDSLLEADIKADGSLHVGQGSICKGNVVAGGDIVFGSFVRFEGIVHAGRRLWLSSGVRGGGASGLVAAYAVQRLFVATDVVVRGKVAAGAGVIATPFSPAADGHHVKSVSDGVLADGVLAWA